MSEKIIARRGQDPRVLTVSEIRARVEDLAEELARQMDSSRVETLDGLEVHPLDTRVFIRLMAAHVHPN